MAVSVLFISSYNSARSQLAEGLLRESAGAAVDVHSAGSAAFGVDPRAVIVMAERGIDISAQRSRELAAYERPLRFDHVITLCERDEKACPVVPGVAAHEEWPLADPARAGRAGVDATAAFRDLRDRLELLISGWLEDHRSELAEPSGQEPVRAGRLRPAASRR